MSRFKMILGVLVMALGFTLMAGCAKPNVVNDCCEPAPMPLYQSPNFSPDIVSATFPEPHREDAVKKWLAPSMRIRNGAISGSGTVCYYDEKKNIAYVISCSHLFRSEAEKTVTLEFFYKNEKKLVEPAKYDGEVIAVKINGYEDDMSVIKFTPDWHPAYFPIGKVDYKYEIGKTLYSLGCDSASEVAAYYVRIVGLDNSFLATIENSPRPGRSGGGLVTEDGVYVGICVRTSDVTGNGTGYFVHLKTIHAFCQKNNLEFLLNLDKIQKNQFRLTLNQGIVDTLVFLRDHNPIP